ncbi:hypothetical protein [Sphaerisporangium album]|uniref:hypothetical protein n=1 Tax=Sphaerisporangium album TaxID=509200 RepID=UPI0015F065B3|nr:hypothetical protein [Sphaerisporangium album]
MFRRRSGLFVAGLYLVAAAVAAVAVVVTGKIDPLWVIATGYTHTMFVALATGDTPLGAVAAMLAVVVGLKAWMLWQVLTLPARAQRPTDRRVIWLRRLLYVAVAQLVIPWTPLEWLPGEVGHLFDLLVWVPLRVLFVLVLMGVSKRFRILGLAVAIASTVLLTLELPGEVLGMSMPWPLAMAGSLVTFAWQVVILVGQRRDGRWSGATITIGRLDLGFALVMTLSAVAAGGARLGTDISVTTLLMGELNVFFVVWFARSARELTDFGARVVHVRHRRSRLLAVASAAAVTLPLLAVIESETTPRLVYSGWGDDCHDWTLDGRRFGDTRPQDRERAFLCHARDAWSTTSPMFPDDLPDQRVLAYGRLLCAVSGRDGQQGPQAPERREAVLADAGVPRSAWGADSDVLVYLCPEVIRARAPHALNSEADARADHARFMAEENARCADPWPGTRARRQGTAAYFLFEGGGYGVYDPDDTSEETSEDASDKGQDDGFVHGAGGSVSVTTYGEGPMCLTVKGFESAPPLRLKGWEQVSEVGVVNRSGRLVVPYLDENVDMGSGRRLPNLAVKGPGRYRVRVYARQVDDAPDPYEQHLVVVFPGRSTKKIVHRDRPLDS